MNNPLFHRIFCKTNFSHTKKISTQKIVGAFRELNEIKFKEFGKFLYTQYNISAYVIV